MCELSLNTSLKDEGMPSEKDEETPQSLVKQRQGLRLKLAPFGLENLGDYEPGGHHPVHLHDRLGKDGRYRVIHKLGKGGFANIWLCRDMETLESNKYVAVKIIMADIPPEDCSELRLGNLKEMIDTDVQEESIAASICIPLDQFHQDGPNGNHLCFVYPVLGPKVSFGAFHASEDPDKILRNVCFAVIKAVSFLHSHGICHGGESLRYCSIVTAADEQRLDARKYPPSYSRP